MYTDGYIEDFLLCIYCNVRQMDFDVDGDPYFFIQIPTFSYFYKARAMVFETRRHHFFKMIFHG